MEVSEITFQNSGYFSKLMKDYLNQEQSLHSLYHRFPTIENFKLQIEEKQHHFSAEKRLVLHQALKDQYQSIQASENTLINIENLKESTTFTITTGHQLNLFTGPLYFIYKIISVVNLTKQLKIQYPEYNFIPVYWMATEDHDFDEINHFYYDDKKICWDNPSKGPVGRLSTQTLNKVLDVFKGQLNNGINATFLKQLFEQSYLQHNNLADATRYLVNELFKETGLVIIDGDNKALKQLFAPSIQDELLKQNSIIEVEKSYKILNDYFIQVTPREINLFYIQNNLRERIIFEDNIYKVNNTSIQFTKEEITAELQKNPENFSPNVILRPLYQEQILPNLCYIGGGGELAYWFELKQVFEAHKTPFPILLLRNSVVLVSEKQNEKRKKLNLSWQDLFLKQQKLIDKKTLELSNNSFDFEEQKKFLINQFKALQELTLKTHPSFIGAVNAQEKKQIKGLENLEKRFFIAEKKLHKEQLDRIINLQKELFPSHTLQERYCNFAQFYEEYGPIMCNKLFEKLKPLNQDFDIVIL